MNTIQIASPRSFVDTMPRESLAAWLADNTPREAMFFGSLVAFQVKTFDEMAAASCSYGYVVAHHRYRSVNLPVALFTFRPYERPVYCIVRDNNSDVVVTVISDDPIDLGDDAPAEGREAIYSGYCEGFPPKIVLGRYRDNHRAFTVSLPTHDALRAVLGQIARHVGSGPRLATGVPAHDLKPAAMVA